MSRSTRSRWHNTNPNSASSGVGVGVGVGSAVAVGVGSAVAVGVGSAVAVGVGSAVAVGVGSAVAVGVGTGVAVPVGAGVASAVETVVVSSTGSPNSTTMAMRMSDRPPITTNPVITILRTRCMLMPPAVHRVPLTTGRDSIFTNPNSLRSASCALGDPHSGSDDPPPEATPTTEAPSLDRDFADADPAGRRQSGGYLPAFPWHDACMENCTRCGQTIQVTRSVVLAASVQSRRGSNLN